MNSKGQVCALPSYDAIPHPEHSETLKWVLEVCQSQQECIVLLEETIAQLKDEVAILKGEKPHPQITYLRQSRRLGKGGTAQSGQFRSRPQAARLPQAQLIQATLFHLLRADVLPNGRLIPPNGRNVIPSSPEMVSRVINQQRVSQPLLLKQLWDFGVQISSGHLNRLLTERQELFHAERAAPARKLPIPVARHPSPGLTGAPAVLQPAAG